MSFASVWMPFIVFTIILAILGFICGIVFQLIMNYRNKYHNQSPQTESSNKDFGGGEDKNAKF